MKTENSEKTESKTALLLIDVISDFEFEDGEKLFKFAVPVVSCIAALKRRAKKKSVPVIYINDNFGKWQDDFRKTFNYCSRKGVRGSEIIKLLKPESDDYFVLKPKHSAFYSTSLGLLLAELKVEILIITGFSTDICVLFTANDAYMRGFRLFVPEDCVAAVTDTDNKYTLKYIERVLKADTRASDKINFDEVTSE